MGMGNFAQFSASCDTDLPYIYSFAMATISERMETILVCLEIHW